MAACYGIIDDTLGPASSSDRATASVRRGTTDSDWVRRTLQVRSDARPASPAGLAAGETCTVKTACRRGLADRVKAGLPEPQRPSFLDVGPAKEVLA